jgi:hypothetical protein
VRPALERVRQEHWRSLSLARIQGGLDRVAGAAAFEGVAYTVLAQLDGRSDAVEAEHLQLVEVLEDEPSRKFPEGAHLP